jgi:hypothetical protein
MKQNSQRSILASALTALALTVALPGGVMLVSMPQPALAQSAVTVENLVIEGEKFSLNIPRLTLEGSSNTQAEIRALFDLKSSEPWAARYAKINARSISMPILELIQTVDPTIKSTTTYRDTVLTNIRSGVIGEMVTPLTTGKTASTTKGVTPPVGDVTVANTVTKTLNIPQILRFLFESGQPSEPLKVVIGESIAGKMTVEGGPEGIFVIAGMRSSDMKLRATPTPAIASFKELETLSKTKSKENDRRTAELGLALATSISLGNFEILGISGEFKPKTGQIGKLNIDRVAMAGGGDVPGRFALQGFGIDAPDGKVKVRDISFEGLNSAACCPP